MAAELAPDLAAIIGHLVTGADDAGQPAVLTGAQAGALDRAHDTLAGFHEDALAWAAGPARCRPGSRGRTGSRSRSASWPARWTHRPALGHAGDGVGRAGARRGQGPAVRRSAGLETVTALLAADASVEVLTGPDGPYPNRRDTGARVYLTIRTGPAPAGPDPRT